MNSFAPSETMHFHPIEHTADEAYLGMTQDPFQVETDFEPGNDALDDVFGTDDDEATFIFGDNQHHHNQLDASHHHPSDIRRLQAEHSTAGYREGVSSAKSSTLQAGFDEGFSLGASVGLKAGQLLGVVEGIAEAVRGLDDAASRRVRDLVGAARDELSVAAVFRSEFWAEDGNWKFDVGVAVDVKGTGAGAGMEQQQTQEDQLGEIVFADVAAAHPLIKKWTVIVDELMVLWKIDRAILDDEGGERLPAVGDEFILSSGTPVAARKPLDW